MTGLWLAALLALPAGAADDAFPYTPPSRSFSCTLPMGWTAFEQATPAGTATHLVGPETAAGWRPAYHVHAFEKGKPGWRTPRQTMKALRRSDDASDRASTGLTSWRVARKPARLFEVREKRFTPAGRLPAELLELHHFYALVPGVGDDYFIVKLTTREAEYLDFRKEFNRFLESLRIVGY
ncbi:MAG: hypothetical protein HYZ75_00145 [Elusimicrobia bacterium]|nr:hypothetical protein [Elusimicrobiota bacterium]